MLLQLWQMELFIRPSIVKACLKCPNHVKEEIRECIANKKVEKNQMTMLLDFDKNEDDS